MMPLSNSLQQRQRLWIGMLPAQQPRVLEHLVSGYGYRSMLPTATRRIRAVLLMQAVAFLAAALVHAGVLLDGYEHLAARNAESVIALVLFGGVVVSWVRPESSRRAGLIAQAFALLGTLVGIFTIIVGVGPRTIPDIVYHIVIAAALILGLAVTLRAADGEVRTAA